MNFMTSSINLVFIKKMKLMKLTFINQVNSKLQSYFKKRIIWKFKK